MSWVSENEEKVQKYMNIGVAALIVGVLLWIFAIQPYFEKKDLVSYQPEGSVSKVTYSKSDKNLSINGGDADLASLVNVGLFEPLKPGDDPTVAKEKLGNPNRFHTEGEEKSEHQNAYREYEMKGYTLLLSTYLTRYASTASTDYEENIYHALESLPHGFSYHEVLRGDALQNIPKEVSGDLKSISVDVSSDNYGPIQLTLVGDRVEKMRWYENRPQ